MPSSASARWRAPIHHFSLAYLLVVPVLLAIATVVVLFVHSDVSLAMLWSQCHSRAALPALSRIPALGTPLCYLISVFQLAIDSVRSVAIMAVILAFIGGLLTVSTVESARVCNAPNVLVAYPTGPWVIFNLLGGAVIWQIAIIPAFLHSAKSLIAERKWRAESGEDSVPEDQSRHLSDSEVIAIPVSVALGFFVPSILMLTLKSAPAVGVWLFFPVYVSLIRQLVRKIVRTVKQQDPALIHLESNRASLVITYAVPIVFSVLTQVFIIWNLTRPDDRKSDTKSALAFIEINVQFIFYTVLYWMLVEVGWKVPLIALVSSIIVGPGAGTAIAWIYRETLVKAPHHDEEERGEGQADQPANEETPLLQE